MVSDVDAPALNRLLDLQDEDTEIKRLHERRSSLPEAQRLAEASELLEELTSDVTVAGQQVEDATRRQTHLEGEMSVADDKIGREEQRLFSGAVANPKELSALQAEVAMLKRKRAELEDALLEVMVDRDQAEETAQKLSGEKNETDATVTTLKETVGKLVEDIDSQIATHEAARIEITAAIPADLLELYEKIRATKGGVGVARLEQSTCLGCHTKLPAREVERLRAEGGIQRCDNCRRILVVA
ncbi:MAG: zinc ribbon domain-containing protein [Actinomycetota bacterium]